MPTRSSRQHLLAGAALVVVVYACSDKPIVTSPPSGITGGTAGEGTGGSTGGSSAKGGGGSSASGGSISVTGGSTATGGGGTGGSGATGGSSRGGNGQGGSGIDYSQAGLPDITFSYEPEAGGEGGACATETGQATLRKRPMDVIVSIDNSLSMQGEIQQVQARINDDFAAILEASDIDYRVILVSRYGNVYQQNYGGGNPYESAYSVCIGSPLSMLTCPANRNDPTPAVANTPPKFYHYSADIGSNDMWCRLTGSYATSDPYPTARTGWVPVAPSGWGAFLRQEAYKVFVGITDDSPTTASDHGCSAMLSGTDPSAWATQFDTALRALDPAQFETKDGGRNYVWYSIVGMAGNAVTNPTPLTPSDPVVNDCCKGDGTVQTTCQGTSGNAFADSAEPGQAYQYLSILTGGLRYPSCYTSNFDAIFNKIAEGVIEGAKASCEYDVPSPSHGIVDFKHTKVSYKPGTGASVLLDEHSSDTDCGSDQGFYYSSDHRKIELCSATCTVVEADPDAKVSIDFGCLGS